MPLPTGTWQDPTQDPPYKKTGEVWDQTTVEDILEDLHFLLGTDGKSPTAGLLCRIGDIILGSPAGNITFSSIPGTFKHLLVVVQARSTSAVVEDNLGMRFNGDSGANYDNEKIEAINTTATAANFAGSTLAYCPYIPGSSVARGALAAAVNIWVPNYASTTFEKSWHAEGGYVDSTAANSEVSGRAGNWRNTAAITQLVLIADGSGGNLATGTRATLYGVN